MDEQRFHFSKISRHVVQDYNVIEMKVSKFSNVKNNRNKLDRTSTYHNTKKTK